MCLLEKLNLSIKTRINPDDQSLEHLFNEFCKSLIINNYTTTIKLNNSFCESCQSPPQSDSIILPCSHFICSQTCFLNFIENQIEDRFENYHKVVCYCNKPISRNIIIQVLGGDEALSRLIKRSSNKYEIKLQCPICLESNK